MADLLLDTVQLRRAGAQLRTVADEFNSAATTAHGLEDAVGHPVLAAAIRGFEGSWDHTRGEMVASIAELADACTGIGDSFAELDSQFAAALRGDA